MTRPDSLKSAAELAEGKPHGTRQRYMGGCRCMLCRAANSRHEVRCAALRRAGLGNGIVPAEMSRKHLKKLSRRGIGKRSVHKASGVSISVIDKIRRGERLQIRQSTERAILSVGSAHSVSDGVLVSAKETWRLINKLLSEGFTKGELAKRLGRKRPALQIRKDKVTAKTAKKVRQFYRMIIIGG